MVNLLAVIGLGFVLGMRHATDPDHVIAVSTIVSRQRSIRQAGVIGALWGIGHTITIFCVGAAIILFNIVIPPRIGLAMELAVGLMLILLGILNLTGITQRITHRYTPDHDHGAVVHSHLHQHQGVVHEHIHGHSPEVHMHLGPGMNTEINTGMNTDQKPRNLLQRMLRKLGLYQFLRPLAIGLVHGLAGSAAVALLVLAEIRDPRWAIAYLLVFGIGTIAGMMVITMMIGAPFAYTRKRFAPFNYGLGVASGLLSLAFGLFITFQIAVTDGLFAKHPHWTPH
ncbi:MAG TPA: high-affinity nickel-transport family protein [Acidobacteriaceae bacterium]|jgi:high-affinity nickel-transport protein|nr:high-affinity nickel-transport family protein [Acidobacteriaceae bacterium]